MTIRVLVADDHPLYRQGVASALTRSGHEVVAEVGSGEAAVTAFTQLRPDVAIMDLDMPGAGGIEAIRAIGERHPDAKVLVLTIVEDEDALLAAIEAGARGYVLKGAGGDEIARAVAAVHGGDVLFGRQVATAALDRFLRGSHEARPFPQLTDSERAVLDLLAAGYRNQEIATALHLGYKTVRNYVSIIFDKLGVRDREEVASLARDAGLGAGKRRT